MIFLPGPSIGGLSLLNRRGSTINWLVRDEFTDTRAAGSVNGTPATPGPGTRTVTDTENKLSVGSGVLSFSGGKATPAWGDPVFYIDSQDRSSGMAMYCSAAAISGSYFAIGWNSSQGGLPDTNFTLKGAGVISLWVGGKSLNMEGTWVSGEFYEYAIVVRGSSGAFFCYRLGGSAIKLGFIDNTAVSSTIYPGIVNNNAVADVDHLRVAQLPAPWNDDYGIATQRLSGSRSPGDMFTHEADCLIEFTVDSLPTSGKIELEFRQQSAGADAWRVTINSAGDLDLDELNSGTPTNRATSAAVVQAAERIVILCEGTTIKAWANSTLAWTYSSATNFQSETAGELQTEGTGGAVSEIIAWPRTLSGSAANALNEMAAG